MMIRNTYDSERELSPFVPGAGLMLPYMGLRPYVVNVLNDTLMALKNRKVGSRFIFMYGPR